MRRKYTVYAFHDNKKQVQTNDRNEPDAKCYWCCAVNVLIIHILHDHMHYSPPVVFPPLRTMQQVGNRPNGGRRRRQKRLASPP